MNGNNEIFNIENNNEINKTDYKINEDNGNGINNGGSQIVNGMNKINKENNTNNLLRDEIDMIQIEQDEDIDDDLNSDEEEEALKIMERESEEAKNQLRGQDRKLRQRLYKQKLRFESLFE